MDSHPKVMTVSYGTFACTLDGFDDPFTTMQLVAEYFRKLSADDRYFGGEPLQPDASHLHRIADNANKNRVDAEVSDNSVILRQADVVDVPTETAPPETETAPILDADTSVNAPINDTVEISHSETTQIAEETDSIQTAFSSRRSLDTAVSLPNDVIPSTDDVAESSDVPIEVVAEPKTDALTTALDENITDTTTADELAPSLEEEISSVVVAASVEALKSDKADESIDRWLETANEKMAMPEHVSKANALERLKAAVAATEAERTDRMETTEPDKIETGEERRENTSSFRRELAKVREAFESEKNIFTRSKNRASSTKQSHPLVLNDGQRVDEDDKGAIDQAQKKSGLTLVSDIESKSPDELPSFEEFSKIMGASTLIELLEASAAYMTLVLGEEQYSEQQIAENLPAHIKRVVRDHERTMTLERLNNRGYIVAENDGNYKISMSRKAAYQKKYLAS